MRESQQRGYNYRSFRTFLLFFSCRSRDLDFEKYMNSPNLSNFNIRLAAPPILVLRPSFATRSSTPTAVAVNNQDNGGAG